MGLNPLRQLTDYEDAVLIWIQENHDGSDELETIRVLSGFDDKRFDQALRGLIAKGCLKLEGPCAVVTAEGWKVWNRLHGRRHQSQLATTRLRTLLNNQVNCLVLGGGREQRQKAIRMGALDYVLHDRFFLAKPAQETLTSLESLGSTGANWVVAFFDVHRIPSQFIWQIRSIAQTQQQVTYILEGARPTSLLRHILGREAAFYQQLTVVDLDEGRKS